MIVCICHRVSDRDIAQAARQGCATFDELQNELGVATACGSCGDCARETFAAHCTSRAAAGRFDAHPRERRVVANAALPGLAAG